MDQKVYKIAAVILLLINGIGAIYGGSMFIAAPDGSLFHMPLIFLEHSPFNDFLIPGIILFIFNGLYSLAIIIFIILKKSYYPGQIIYQGIVLLIWIVSQLIMIRRFDFVLHTTFLLIGALLIFFGKKLQPKHVSGLS
jgi:hypothetical protein